MRFLLFSFFVLSFATGCGRSGDPSSSKSNGDGFLRCAQPYSDGFKERFSLPPLTIERNGSDVDVKGIKHGLIVVGLLAGITENTQQSEKNVDLFLEKFKNSGVQAIVVAGGLGSTAQQVGAILDNLAKAPVPILVCPGAQENYDIFKNAVRKAREKNPQILDMTRVRRFRIGNVTIVSLPGYHKPFYLEAGERGCAYNKGDLEKTVNLFEKKRTNVLLSPSPPRGAFEHCVDRGRGHVNIGDEMLAQAMKSSQVKFGLFGHVYESGGHATTNSGAAVASGVWQESLFIQAGSADAVPVSFVGGGRSTGMAQIVEFSGGRGRFRTLTAH